MKLVFYLFAAVHVSPYSDKKIIMMMLLAFAGCAMSLTAYNAIVTVKDYFERTEKKPRDYLETRSDKRRKRTISKMQKLLGSNKTKKEEEEEEEQPEANAAEDPTAKDKTKKHGAKPIEGHGEGQAKDTKQGQAKDTKQGQAKDAKQGRAKNMKQGQAKDTKQGHAKDMEQGQGKDMEQDET